jgi:hypothetical protein
MKSIIQIALAVLIVVLSYMVYNSVNSSIVINEQKNIRKEAVIEKLKDIRMVQLAYKSKYKKFLASFDDMMNFINQDSLPIILQIGDAEDSVAVASGLVVRDTTYISVKDSLFSKSYIAQKNFPFYIDSIPFVPFSGGEKFKMDAGEITKNNAPVKVFEASCTYGQIMKDLDIRSTNIKPNGLIQVGSMTEASTNGNWE